MTMTRNHSRVCFIVCSDSGNPVGRAGTLRAIAHLKRGPTKAAQLR
jgi:hypothetical protein